jgi:hypothetical protein
MATTVFFAMLTPLTACAPTIMQMSLAPADAEEASAMLGPGTGTIKGSALLRQRGGGVVTCAGNDVFLIPATLSAVAELRRVFGDDKGYVERGGDTNFGGGKLVAPPKPNRSSLCNAQGFFTFSKVRAGKWYVMTNVTWTVNDDYQGGTLLGTADVAEGEETEIVLTR